MTAVKARPTLLPICATVLKTPPARACVLSGKASVMIKLDAVNKTSGPRASGFYEDQCLGKQSEAGLTQRD